MDQGDAERLRRRLYRPGASDADVASYLDAAEPVPSPDAADAPSAAGAGERGASLRPFAIGGLAVLVVAAFGGALLIGGPAAPVSVPAPTPTRAAAVGSSDGKQVWFVSSGAAPVLDGGERDGARGPAVAEGPDLVRYTVASGDTVGAVAQRFSLCQGDVLLALPYGVDPAALPGDQMLELSRSSTRSPPDC